MSSSPTFSTHSLGVAAYIRYVLGPLSHLRTKVDEHGRASYTFDDVDESCSQLGKAFSLSEAAVPCARSFLQSFYDVRNTTFRATEHDGLWENPNNA